MQSEEDIWQEFGQLNEDELFYREYYEAQQDKPRLQEFLRGLDYQEIYRRQLIVEDGVSGYWPVAMTDAAYFKLTDRNSIVLTRHNRYTPAFLHQHDFFEMAYILKGKCQQDINGEQVQLTAGEFCLIAPQVKHAVSVFDDESIVINILMRRATFEEVFSGLLSDTNAIAVFFNKSLFTREHSPFLILATNGDEQLRGLVIAMYREYRTKEQYYEGILNSELMIVFAKILQQYGSLIRYPQNIRQWNDKAVQLLGYIEENFRDVTLQGLAERFHYSEGYTSRLLHRATGRTFTEFVLQIKFRHAQDMLEHTRISIAKLSLLSGFANVEHFNRMFKKRYGMTPGEWRKAKN